MCATMNGARRCETLLMQRAKDQCSLVMTSVAAGTRPHSLKDMESSSGPKMRRGYVNMRVSSLRSASESMANSRTCSGKMARQRRRGRGSSVA